jgi:hypothetical protein
MCFISTLLCFFLFISFCVVSVSICFLLLLMGFFGDVYFFFLFFSRYLFIILFLCLLCKAYYNTTFCF